MTANEKLVREYAERTNHTIICIDTTEYGHAFAVLKANGTRYIYLLVMVIKVGNGKRVEPIRYFDYWRKAKRAYSALAYEQ